ncbi:MAG: serine/threonine-protein kinase [Acidobacteriota bacterium]
MRRWESIESLFDQAAAMPRAEQQAFLNEACGDDRELLLEVRSLLETDRSSSTLLETPALELEAKRLASRMLLPLGCRLGDYRIEQLISAGEFSAVYRATDMRTGRRAALKLLPSEPQSTRRQSRRFEREARTLAAINDPRVPKLYGTGEVEGFRYLAEEYVEGETLHDRMLNGEKLPGGKILELAVQIAEVLAKAHARGVIHRDIKPANLMISNTGQVKVLDFGIVKFFESDGMPSELDSRAGTLTQAGTIIGTFDYMSPEQLMGEPVDHRTDLFSLGLLLYQLTTGRKPFESRSFLQRVASLNDWNLAPATQLAPDLDPRLATVIDRCLRRHPDQRYPAAEELLADLEGTSQHHTEDKMMQHKHRVLLTIDGLVNLVVGVLLLFSPAGVAVWLGLPATGTSFYASILGAVILGIGLALLLELRAAPRRFRGLGLGGAIAINLSGGGALLVWLIAVPLGIPLRGYIILWIVALVVLVIGIVELATKSWKYE